MARAYFATRLSENISRTPEGFLVCRDAVIARTGWQQYQVRDLHQERAAELGVNLSDPNASIDLYRSPEEVFAPSCIASFEGKPVCDGHPPEFVDTENFREHTRGHAQNVRKGIESLESGDWPLIADLIVSDEALIRKIDAGLRELSCGYDYSLDREADRILQVAIVGNHIAVVPKGRAGAEARINDSAEETKPVIGAPAASSGNPTKKEKAKVKATDKLLELLGLGLKAKATDATPEELAEYAGVIKSARAADCGDSEEEKAKKAADAMKAAKDAEEAEKKAKDEKEASEKADKEAKDKAAKDAEKEAPFRTMTEEDGHRCKDCMGKDEKCTDCMMHDSLDQMIDNQPESDGMEELMNLVADFAAGKGADDADKSEVIEPVGEDEEAVKGNDAALELLPFIEKTKDTAVRKAFDAAPLENEAAFLKSMRPAIARTTDKAVRKAFDAALRKFTRSSKVSDASYGAFARSSARSIDSNQPAANFADMDAMYAKFHGQNHQEVK